MIISYVQFGTSLLHMEDELLPTPSNPHAMTFAFDSGPVGPLFSKAGFSAFRAQRPCLFLVIVLLPAHACAVI